MSTTTKKARTLAASALLAAAFVLTLGSAAEAMRSVKFCGGDPLDCTWQLRSDPPREGTFIELQLP